MLDPAIALTRDLVAIPSVNPSLVPGAAGEAGVADLVAARLRSAGVDVEVREVLPGRPNVVGVIEAREPGPTLLFCGHLDTVGVEGMAAPFDPVMRDGRLHGRGAQDMKSGVAAMVHAAEVIAARKALRRGRLVVAAVIDEEYASAGADALVEQWRADAAIITEPTDLLVGIAHKGFSAAEIVVRGVAAHGSRPADGRDAILRMGRVLARLEALDRDLQARTPHALLGTASLHASAIEGGGELSSYPALCRLLMERRTLPGEPLSSAADELQSIADAVLADDPLVQADVRLLLARPAYLIEPTDPLPVALLEACAGRGTPSGTTGLSFWTDAAILAEAGTRTVLFGPGGAGLHGTEEYVRVDDVVACRDVLVAVASRWGSIEAGEGRVYRA